MNSMLRRLILIWGFETLVSCKATPSPLMVKIQVLDEKMGPISRAQITVNQRFVGETDKNGRFKWQGRWLKKQKFVFKVEKKSDELQYSVEEQKIIPALNPKQSIHALGFVLYSFPLRKAKESTEPVPDSIAQDLIKTAAEVPKPLADLASPAPVLKAPEAPALIAPEGKILSLRALSQGIELSGVEFYFGDQESLRLKLLCESKERGFCLALSPPEEAKIFALKRGFESLMAELGPGSQSMEFQLKKAKNPEFLVLENRYNELRPLAGATIYSKAKALKDSDDWGRVSLAIDPSQYPISLKKQGYKELMLSAEDLKKPGPMILTLELLEPTKARILVRPSEADLDQMLSEKPPEEFSFVKADGRGLHTLESLRSITDFVLRATLSKGIEGSEHLTLSLNNLKGDLIAENELVSKDWQNAKTLNLARNTLLQAIRAKK